MNRYILYAPAASPALAAAGELLRQKGGCFLDHPSPEITHLLLPVPSLEGDDRIRGGGSLREILSMLPEHTAVIGGDLTSPVLAGHPAIDLLRDEGYLAENAAITAHCALKEAACRLPATLCRCPVLVLGWGRIGKCLSRLLQSLGASVTVAARKETDRAMAAALGYEAEAFSLLHRRLPQARVIFNTVPAPVLSEAQTALCRPGCLMIDLASRPGIAGPEVVSARGLPGRDAPESSGALIAATILRLLETEAGV